MVRIGLKYALIICFAAQGAQVPASPNTFFWLSNQGWPSEKGIPASPATIPAIYNFNTQGSSSLYIWARPEMGLTLKNWSLDLLSTNSSVLNFTSSTVFGAGVTGVNRWQNLGQPTGNSTSIQSIAGFTITSGSGLGIGPATKTSDAYYNPTTDAWLLARVDYTLQPFSSLTSTDLYLRIGSFGMTNSSGTTSDVDVVFGHSSETSLNAKTQRQMISSVRDAVLHYYPRPDADFDGDMDADGRDFLIWQRNFTNVGPKNNSQGNANVGSTAGLDMLVNHIDLAAWQFQYGMTVNPTLQAVPEPGSWLLAAGFAAAVLTIRRRMPSKKLIRGPSASVYAVSIDREGVGIP